LGGVTKDDVFLIVRYKKFGLSMHTWTLMFLVAIRIISEEPTAESAGWLFIKAMCSPRITKGIK